MSTERFNVVVVGSGAGGGVIAGELPDDGASGVPRAVEADVVVVAAGTLATPQLLIRSGVRNAAGGSPSSQLIGRHVGFHPARLVEGLFDEVQLPDGL